MKLIEGGSLAQSPPRAARERVEVMVKVARAVHYAHQRGILHRDLKPANVLLTADGTPKITDFGLAKKLGEVGQTQSGVVLGTPSYMAPEQAAGRTKALGPAVDVYALGAILYEALTGRPPFKGATPADTLLQVLSVESVPPRQLQPSIPRDLETICLKCLHKEASKRYGSAAALAENLGRLLRGEPIRARPVGTVERLLRWGRRNRALAAALAGVFAALVSGMVGTTWGLVRTERARQAETARAEGEARAKVQAQDNEQKAVEQRQRAETAETRARTRRPSRGR
jgi:serine/threonine-protein kinase